MTSATDRLLPAIGLRLIAAALFAAMGAAIKAAELGGAALAETLFFRQFGAMILVGAIVGVGPGFATLRTQRLPAHLLRTAVGLSSMACNFAALFLLPLAEATAISFSMPIFATIMGALFLAEPTGWRRWLAVLTGFAGVMVVTQPGGGTLPLAGIGLGLLAAFLSAAVSILLRTMGRSEPPVRTVFWFSGLSAIVLLPFYLSVAQPHPAATWAALLAIGVLGGLAQIAMTTSLTLGPVSVVVPMDYTALIWATLLGWLAFDRLPATATWLGAPIIVASGLYIIWREHVRRREETQAALAT